MFALTLVITSLAGAVAKYCNERVCICVCLCVCLCVSRQGYVRNHLRDLYQLFVHAARGSILLWRGDHPPRGRSNFGEKVAAHCKVMGNSTVSCAKTAEPNEMSFWTKTRLGSRNHALDGVQIPQQEGAIFGGCPGHLKALAIFGAAIAAASLWRSMQKGIIQLPIASCSRRDHSVCQASANSILKILGAGDAAYRPRRGWWDCTARAKYDI